MSISIGGGGGGPPTPPSFFLVKSATASVVAPGNPIVLDPLGAGTILTGFTLVLGNTGVQCTVPGTYVIESEIDRFSADPFEHNVGLSAGGGPVVNLSPESVGPNEEFKTMVSLGAGDVLSLRNASSSAVSIPSTADLIWFSARAA